MDNGTNLSQQQINSIIDKAKELSSKGKPIDSTFIENQLSPAQSEKLRAVMNDPEKLRAIMNSPMAKKLLSLLNSEKKE